MTVRVEPYRPDDVEAAVAFFQEAAAHDTDILPPTPADWRSYVGQTSIHDGTDRCNVATASDAAPPSPRYPRYTGSGVRRRRSHNDASGCSNSRTSHSISRVTPIHDRPSR